MTDHDLQRAREELDERIDTGQDRRSRRTLAAVAAAAVVVAVAGSTALQSMGDGAEEEPQPADSGPAEPVIDPDAAHLFGDPPTAELVHGVWREDNGGTMLLFRRDGTVQVDSDGTLYSDPLVTGTYEIDGDEVTVNTDPGTAAGCSEGFVLRVSIPEVGSMRSVRADPDGDCPPMEAGQEVWEQVLPASPAMNSWKFSFERGWRPVRDAGTLEGDWLAEGGGHVLELAPNGEYHVADDTGEPIDQGRWTGSGTELTLTSSDESAQCSRGDQVLVGDIEELPPGGTPVIRWTVQRSACGTTWSPASWFQIPSEPDFR